MVNNVSKNFVELLSQERVLAIVRGTDPDAAITAAVALMECGVRMVEISLVSANALLVISEVVKAAPSGCLVGAGTVLTRQDVAAATNAGASFLVTPALADSVAESVVLDVPVLAGALTPSEIVRAVELGAAAVKLFPASVGGSAYLRALRAPFPSVPFVPVGGVDASGARDFLAAGAVAVGIGGPLIGDAASGGSLSALKARAAVFLAVAAGLGT